MYTHKEIGVWVFFHTGPCSLVEVDWRFEGAYCPHHQGDESKTADKLLSPIFQNAHLHTWRHENLKCHTE
jgi:hypothetical protein